MCFLCCMHSLARLLLAPFAAIHSAVVFLRNRAYDYALFSSKKAIVPTVVIGNLAMGGTGKTPLTILLLKKYLKEQVAIAFLSRGYGRASKGFQQVSSSSLSINVGDEPKLIRKAVPTIPMAVCENRVEGVNTLVQIHPSIQAVVLDDGFQHRALKASVYILTTQFSALFSKDFLFPMGYLRDNRREAKRAAAIVVTKCPPGLSKNKRDEIEIKIRQSLNQSIFFTSTVYGDPLPVFDHLPPFDKSKGVIAFSGLAQNSEFQNAVNGAFSLKKFKDYPDHHHYGVADVALFDKEMHTFDPRSVILLTTEKDAVKWSEIKEAYHLPLYFLPITMSFLEKEEEFTNLVTRSIR